MFDSRILPLLGKAKRGNNRKLTRGRIRYGLHQRIQIIHFFDERSGRWKTKTIHHNV